MAIVLREKHFLLLNFLTGRRGFPTSGGLTPQFSLQIQTEPDFLIRSESNWAYHSCAGEAQNDEIWHRHGGAKKVISNAAS